MLFKYQKNIKAQDKVNRGERREMEKNEAISFCKNQHVEKITVMNMIIFLLPLPFALMRQEVSLRFVSDQPASI
jgi:hypothetical protein